MKAFRGSTPARVRGAWRRAPFRGPPAADEEAARTAELHHKPQSLSRPRTGALPSCGQARPGRHGLAAARFCVTAGSRSGTRRRRSGRTLSWHPPHDLRARSPLSFTRVGSRELRTQVVEVAASADEVSYVLAIYPVTSAQPCGSGFVSCLWQTEKRVSATGHRAEGRWSGSPRDLHPDTSTRWLQPRTRVWACEPLAEGLRSAWAVRRRDQRSRRHRLARGTRKGEWLDTRLAAACRQQLADHVR